MAFLTFIFFIFIGFFVLLLAIIVSFYRQIRHTARKFRPGGQYENNPKPNADGNIIIDHRSESQRNRQVISDDEGEYVDFT